MDKEKCKKMIEDEAEINKAYRNGYNAGYKRSEVVLTQQQAEIDELKKGLGWVLDSIDVFVEKDEPENVAWIKRLLT